MQFGVLMLNFGEPEHATPQEVGPFLERIFLNNTPLERFPDQESWRARCLELAEKRTPGLVEDYRRIGGSPLNRQARAERDALDVQLAGRGHQTRVYLGYQFVEPSIEAAVREAKNDGCDALVALPIYPICGFSTNVAALQSVADAIQMLNWQVPVHEVAAWQNDRAYTAYRAENIRQFVSASGLDLADPETLLYFSAHGTPIKYLDMGSRYDGYVEEHCAAVAHQLGNVPYTLAYQNHSNRGIAWTQPDNAEHLPSVGATRLVVEPISFIHEQSETLGELDLDFRDEAAKLGKEVFRVPTPADPSRLAGVFADLIDPFLRGTDPHQRGLAACRCRPGAFCTNGGRDLDCHHRRTS